MKRSELLFKCETAALLLTDAKKKVGYAQRQLELPLFPPSVPVRKPPSVATSKVISIATRRAITA